LSDLFGPRGLLGLRGARRLDFVDDLLRTLVDATFHAMCVGLRNELCRNAILPQRHPSLRKRSKSV
jgi:hypothetical protein